MPGLTEQAGGGEAESLPLGDRITQAHQAWEASLLRQVEALRQQVQSRPRAALAALSGGEWQADWLLLSYWGQPVRIRWSPLVIQLAPQGQPASVFDSALLLYYLNTADGTPLSGRWLSFRELPGGTFYHQAFQGYSGDRLARAFADAPLAFQGAARALGGVPLGEIGEYAFAFDPLPRLRLAALLWLGDEEFPARAAILFDASASHYLPIDGLALLGSGLARRLLRAAPSSG